MKTYIFESIDWAEAEDHGLTKQGVRTVVDDAMRLAADLLPTMSRYLNISVRPYFGGIVPEYGTGGYTRDSEFIELWFDKTVPHGAEKTLQNLLANVLHESNHSARWNHIDIDYRMLEGAVFEGLATVFERQYANHSPLYGEYGYDATMKNWLKELTEAGADYSRRNELFFEHPDGRRWVGYKTGTWIVDRAIAKSGQSVIDLTTKPVDEILHLAELD